MRSLYRRARMKGLIGGSRAWTIVWVVLFGSRVLRRLFRNKPDIVYVEELAEGDSLVISAKERVPRVISL